MVVTSFKCENNGELRRFPAINSFNDLVARIVAAYELPPLNSISLKYVDDEGDLVSFNSDSELSTAMDQSPSSTLKLVCECDANFEVVKSRRGPDLHELSEARKGLQHVPTVVKSVADLGLSHVYSERQGKAIKIESPVNQSLANLKKSVRESRKQKNIQQSLLDAVVYRRSLKPTRTTVKSIRDMIGTSQVYSERQGKVITLLEAVKDDKDNKVNSKALREGRGALRPTRTNVKSVSDILGTNRVFSERQGKVITLQEPTEAKVTSAALLNAQSTLQPTRTKVRSVSDVLGTNRVFSERQGKVITLQEPTEAKVTPAALLNARSTLQPSCTCVRTITDVLGTNCVFSERQGKVITLQEPTTAKVTSAALLNARSTLQPSFTCVRSVSDVLGTNRVFSERQGKCITLREPLRAGNVKASTLCSARCSLKPTSTRVCTVSEMLGTNCVFSERQGKIITLKEPATQSCAPGSLAAASRMLMATLGATSNDKALNIACEESLTNFLTALSKLINKATPAKSPAELLLAEHSGDFKEACIALMKAASC